jgi:hypothetical protein
MIPPPKFAEPSAASSMSESTEPTKFTKLRTTIVVVSMIVMPLCAVIGVKMPKFLNDLTTESVGVSNADSKAKPTAKATGTAGRDRSKPKPLERAVSLAEAEGGRAATDFAPTSPYVSLAAATQPGANSDVRATGSGVSQAVALESLAGGSTSGEAASVGFDTPGTIRPLPPADEPARPATAPPAGGAGAGDQFSHIQSRLKALGAMHYALETWGPGGNSYRFQCRMAAGHSADYTRQFEATDTDPLRTMQTVLDEVEAWKAGRLP